MQAFANPEDARAFSPKKDDKANYGDQDVERVRRYNQQLVYYLFEEFDLIIDV
jgi:hypothetical protein